MKTNVSEDFEDFTPWIPLVREKFLRNSMLSVKMVGAQSAYNPLVNISSLYLCKSREINMIPLIYTL